MSELRRFRKLFQLPGRSDRNCADCNADIATLISLYGRLEKASLTAIMGRI
jgi:hypothetical protein